jgi:hypothetical protein
LVVVFATLGAIERPWFAREQDRGFCGIFRIFLLPSLWPHP